VSTGKEANVYYSTMPNGAAIAIKVYRTSVLVFKDRERYVEGDFRFQRYCKSNPRKMVKVWAEKESRNLRRLEAAGIPAPRVLQLRHHVLLMSFLGEDGWPMPRLHEAPQCVRRHGPHLYTTAIQLLKDMYAKCNLVHGDYSEYNILVDLGKDQEVDLPILYVIDVSQSVEPDHPNATTFLRRDIANVNRFFCDFVEPSQRTTIEDMYGYIVGRDPILRRGQVETDELRDAVFQQIPIPRALGGYTTKHCSADVERQYGILKDVSAATGGAQDESTSGSEEGSNEESGEEDEEGRPRRTAAVSMTKEERKQHKKEVKEANRERRKTKVPKHVKKKKCGKK
jgi:RIO kinase 1